MTRPAALALVAAALLAGSGSFRALSPVWSAARTRGGLSRGLALALLAGAPLVLLTLYPPTGFDETLYHLPFIRAIAGSGAMAFLDGLRFPVFPQLDEMLGVLPYLAAGDTGPHVVHLVETVLTALLLVAWGRRIGAPSGGLLAAGLFVGSPLVVHLATSGYVEPGLTLFATAALYAADAARESDADAWPLLAGFFGGCAASTKYLGLFFLLAAGLLVVAAGRKRRARSVAFLALAGVVGSAVAYGRLIAETGNPVFPFATGLFGPNDWALDRFMFPGRSVCERLRLAALLPWDVVVDRASAGSQPPISPALVAGLPLVVAGAFRRPNVRAWTVVLVAYVGALSFLPRDARYLTPVLPLASLAMSLVAAEALRGRVVPEVRFRLVLALAALAAATPGCLYAAYRMVKQGPIPASAASRDSYLARRVPGYAAIAYLNASLGNRYTVYACRGENLISFASGRFLGDWSGPASYWRVLGGLGPSDAETLKRRLVALGADHLLALDGGCSLAPISALALRRRLPSVYRDARAEVFRVPAGGDEPSPAVSR